MKRQVRKKPRGPVTGAQERTLPFPPPGEIVAKDGSEVPDQVRRYVNVLIRERLRILNRILNPELTLYEAAILLRVSRNTLRRLTNDGALQCTRTGGQQRRFKLNDILVYLARNDPALAQAMQTVRDWSFFVAQVLKDLKENVPPEP
jgi:excisionase family DNA binding protein